MSVRAWIVAVAIGLAAPSLGKAQIEADGGEDRPADAERVTDPQPYGIPVRIVEDDEAAQARQRREAISDQREEDDLVAQQGMNAATQAMNVATQSMKWAAWVSAGLVGLGTVLLVWTLSLTRQANRAAQRAVEVTRTVGEAQVRAYLSVEVRPAPRLTEIGHVEPIPLKVRITNKGASPARNVRQLAKTMIKKADLDTPCPDLIIPKLIRRHGVIIASGKDQEGTVESELVYSCIYDAPSDGKAAYLAGIVFYDDVFGHQHKHRFCYRIDVLMDGDDIHDHWSAESARLRFVRSPVHNDETSQKKS